MEVLQLFKCSNAVGTCTGIMFDFFPGLPHMYSTIPSVSSSTLMIVFVCAMVVYRCVPAGAPTRRCMSNICEERNTSGYELALSSLNMSVSVHTCFISTHRTRQLSAESKVHVCEYTLHYNSRCLFYIHQKILIASFPACSNGPGNEVKDTC